MKRNSKITPSESVIEMNSKFEQSNDVPAYEIEVQKSRNKAKFAGKRTWRGYRNGRRKFRFLNSPLDDSDIKKLSGPGLCPNLDLNTYGCYDGTLGGTSEVIDSQIKSTLNRNLIQYFARLGDTKQPIDYIDLEFVETLVDSGADIESTDQYGQTVLHEIARSWCVDVAKFFIEQLGADVNKGDDRGRTPLHIAAIVDYPEMCDYLIRAGANYEAKTYGESQTPVFFAARNDSDLALRSLLKHRCRYKRVKDYKGRSPLALAAEMNRSKTVKLLLDMGAPADTRDDSGQPAIVPIVSRMGPLANRALDQFLICDGGNRKQYFHLWKLEPYDSEDATDRHFPGVLQTIVYQRHYGLVMHPVIQRLLNVMWDQFAKSRVVGQIVFQVLFVVAWTTVSMSAHWTVTYRYDFPVASWRIAVLALAVALTLGQIIEEFLEMKSLRKLQNERKLWRQQQIDRDKKFCHPMWKNELEYLEQEERTLQDISPSYTADGWNTFDWICYSLVIVTTIIHIFDVFYHSLLLARYHVRIEAVMLIVIWTRLLKIVRAFSTLGPFIVILSHIMIDILKFLFLYMEFFIPFVFAFYITIGGYNNPAEGITNIYATVPSNSTLVNVTGFGLFNDAMFALFRMTLIGNYDYDNMIKIDKIMSQLLVGFWFAISNILCINLFIALLSDTFARVYDNAQENACMQKAITVLNIMDGLYENRTRQFVQYFHENCNPYIMYYDSVDRGGGMGDANETQRNTAETYDIVLDIQRQLLDFFNRQNEEEEEELCDEDGFAYTERRKSLVSGFSQTNTVSYRGSKIKNQVDSSMLFKTTEIELRHILSTYEEEQQKIVKDLRSDIADLKAFIGDIGMLVAELTSQGPEQPASNSRRKKKKRGQGGSSDEPTGNVIQVAPAKVASSLPMKLETYPLERSPPRVSFVNPPEYNEKEC